MFYFTICVPVYNREKTVIRTLESVIKQTFNDYEILIIDDGSTDDSANIINNWIMNNDAHAKLITKINGGKHTALNIAFSLADSVFFMILDSDDWLKSDNTLEEMYNLCQKIEKNNEYSGVMGRCINSKTGQMMGDLFPSDPYISSYIDYHFWLPRKIKIGDCCECNKTKIINQYRFPEPEQTKFVPEAWLFDQIGVKYKLLCTNKVFEEKEYMINGLSADTTLKTKNYIGFLYHYTSRIENIMPKTNLPLAVRLIAWWRYWQMVKLDKESLGPRCKKITISGKFVRIIYPIITIAFRIRYRSIYMAGR